ncbi:MAG TPA: LytTR family DNA-binding domain-containing protein [Mucilaginibacter sp.]|jgi:DNA-binding LytR/AlgR family response regulator
MKKLSCIIVDDEPVARKILYEFVEQVPYMHLQGKFENAMKAEYFLKNNETDIMFLDIEMPKISGLQLLKNIEKAPLVIITTAFPQYALEGYELEVIDYLLKPISFNRFIKAVQKAREYKQMQQSGSFMQSASWLFVKSDKRIEKIELNDILFAETLGNYVIIHLQGKKIIAYLTLKSLESQLPSNEFIKIHQSFLVNCSRISAIEGNEIKIDDKSLPISRNHRDSVMDMVQQRILKR